MGKDRKPTIMMGKDCRKKKSFIIPQLASYWVIRVDCEGLGPTKELLVGSQKNRERRCTESKIIGTYKHEGHRLPYIFQQKTFRNKLYENYIIRDSSRLERRTKSCIMTAGSYGMTFIFFQINMYSNTMYQTGKGV